MDLRTLTAWRYVDLPVGTPNATQSKAATSLVSLSNHKIKRWLHDIAFPMYDCEDCIGVGGGYPCWCAHYGARAPGEPPEWWRVKLQRLMMVPGPEMLYSQLCQAMPQCDTLEELEDHETHFVTLIVMAVGATVFRLAQVML